MKYNLDYPTWESVKVAFRNYLIMLARNHQTTTYGKAISDTHIPLKTHVANDRALFGKLLGEISEEEMAHDRPAISVLVLRKDSMLPSLGFYNLMKSYESQLEIDTIDSQLRLFALHLTETFKYWSKK